MEEFKKELKVLINKYSKENGSDTPDFILADYLVRCLENFDKTMKRRTEYYKPHAYSGAADASEANRTHIMNRFYETLMLAYRRELEACIVNSRMKLDDGSISEETFRIRRAKYNTLTFALSLMNKQYFESLVDVGYQGENDEN